MRTYITLYTAPSRSTKQSIHNDHLWRRQIIHCGTQTNSVNIMSVLVTKSEQ